MWMRKLTPLLIMICAAGCVQTADPCTWAAPIRPALADELTPGTARQILAHNETGARVCGWTP
jgi:hypothetical protein